MDLKDTSSIEGLLEDTGFKKISRGSYYSNHRDLWVRMKNNEIIASAHNDKVKFEVEDRQSLEQLIRDWD